jgi:Na+/H+ antiporter NhaC
MLVYGLGWMGLMMLTGVVLSLLMVLLGGTSLMGLLSMPLALALTSAYYVSLFFTFRDSFGQAE